jgi:hypothetical protein
MLGRDRNRRYPRARFCVPSAIISHCIRKFLDGQVPRRARCGSHHVIFVVLRDVAEQLDRHALVRGGATGAGEKAHSSQCHQRFDPPHALFRVLREFEHVARVLADRFRVDGLHHRRVGSRLCAKAMRWASNSRYAAASTALPDSSSSLASIGAVLPEQLQAERKLGVADALAAQVQAEHETGAVYLIAASLFPARWLSSARRSTQTFRVSPALRATACSGCS